MLQVSAWGNERDNRDFRLDFAFFGKELFFNGLLGPERARSPSPSRCRHDILMDRPEWPLVKASIIAGAAFPVAAAVGDFYEAAARLIE